MFFIVFPCDLSHRAATILTEQKGRKMTVRASLSPASFLRHRGHSMLHQCHSPQKFTSRKCGRKLWIFQLEKNEILTSTISLLKSDSAKLWQFHLSTCIKTFWNFRTLGIVKVSAQEKSLLLTIGVCFKLWLRNNLSHAWYQHQTSHQARRIRVGRYK